MGRTDEFTGLSEFLAVAEHSSFRAAAAALGVTPGAVSQAIRSLERRVGLPLFQPTTRHVGLTEAGARFLSRLRPAAAEIGGAISEMTGLRSRPAGLLRLSVPRITLDVLLVRVLDEFRREYPDVSIEIDVNGASVDLATHRLDAGIRIGNLVDKDMVAVRLTSQFRWMVVGAPAYFSSFGTPRTPKDLLNHECIRYRFPSAGSLYRWQFINRGREFSLNPPGRIVVNDHLLMVALARKGIGLAYTADLVAARELAEGALQSVLGHCLPTKPGLFLYFPRNSQAQPKLRAFIDIARRQLPTSPAAS
jgi:DNA-binding transcriptional LysR family regulator